MCQITSYIAQLVETIGSYLPVILASVYPLFSFLPVVVGLTAMVSLWTYRSYCRDLEVTLKHYRTPKAWMRAMDDKPFRMFLLQCINRWYYYMLSSLAIVLAVVINLNLEAVQNDIQNHLILQVLAVLTIAQALSSLFLSILYMDVVNAALMTYGHTLVWVEGAIAAREQPWFNTAVVMAMPTVWTAGAIITFTAYHIAFGVIWIISPEDLAWTHDDGAHQLMAIVSVLCMVFVMVQTAYAAKVFQSIKDFAGPIPQIGSKE
ncbi:hypothetical protein PHLGIDRAFT_117927 [Phlebiopsis gigantea 11061_1 CR5-6]|uniref:Uncharacterized protein n=1 Tax=Phlebiopsis gigantea (strain 11061_1 CR5-6) TaxID=745531 RepID=A0A0C3NR24_PHLG1|nr:hypothetical protein PHLGIDRAFT_117927 [Phlebiopsis gigantea 11061_1 CR5-6]